jgi:hypothetical protein
MNYLFKILACVVLFFATLQNSFALTPPDSTKQEKPAKMSAPKKAALLSAVLPGLGQAYNKKYWKIPVLYAGGATLGYFISFNNKNYKRFKKAVIIRNEGKIKDEFAETYPNIEQLRTGREFYRRNRDLLVIVSAFTYLLNIADATVDAHLATFDVSDDLALRVRPSQMNVENFPTSQVSGLSLQLCWKK